MPHFLCTLITSCLLALLPIVENSLLQVGCTAQLLRGGLILYLHDKDNDFFLDSGCYNLLLSFYYVCCCEDPENLIKSIYIIYVAADKTMYKLLGLTSLKTRQNLI